MQQRRSGRTEGYTGTTTQRRAHKHTSTRGSATTRVIRSDLGAVRPGFSQQGIYGASRSSITVLCCQKPSFGVTALNLAESNRQRGRTKERTNRVKGTENKCRLATV